MTFSMILLAAIILAIIALFAWDVYPADKVGLLTLGALLGTRLITPEQAVSGFGDPATITVACMLALSYGIQRTGGLDYFAQKIMEWGGRSEAGVALAVMISVGVLSAFINNTAAVALFLPLTISLARRQELAVSKLLMPMSFAAIFAGTCTLIGTSTNLVVSQRADFEIGLFEPTLMGLIFFAAGILYMLFVGRRLIPVRRAGRSLTEAYRLRQFVTDLKVDRGSPLIGQTLDEIRLGELYGVEVVEILRQRRRLLTISEDARIEEADDLLVAGSPEALIKIGKDHGLTMKALEIEDKDLEDENLTLVEAWIAPNSPLIESTLKEINFRKTYRATALAIRSHGGMVQEKIGTFRLEYGDALLILTSWQQLDALRRSPDFLVIEEVSHPIVPTDKIYWALGIFLFMVLGAASGLLSILQAAILAVAAMVVTKCVRLNELYSNISWQTIVLLACLLPLGHAMKNTGLGAEIAQQLVDTLKGWGPTVVLSGLYAITTLLTGIMTNNATAILMVGIAANVAAQLGVRPEPFVFAVMFAASACFMTPVGYQTNLFIFGPGGYRFSDFIRVGTPLNVIFWILATLFIPRIWPF